MILETPEKSVQMEQLQSKVDEEEYDKVSSVEDTTTCFEENIPTVSIRPLPFKLKWKIDFMIMPFFITIYFLQFLDKSLLNYAAIMGIKKNLHGNQFANLGTIFYIGFVATEPVAAILIQKLPVAKYLNINICCWGAIVSFHAVTKTYAGLMIVRVLLGIFEASVACCMIIIMGMWWTKAEQSRRTCLWFMQIGVAQIVGSLISFGFQHVRSTSIASWQIMFIFMGIVTFIVGVLTTIFLPDNPLTCRYLSSEEKTIVLEHIRANNIGMENRTYKFYQVKEMLLEAETWIMFFIVIFSLTDGGGLNVFSSQIIQTFGFSNEVSAIIQIPMGLVSIISAILCCWVTSFTGEYALMLAFVTAPSILGAGLFMGLAEHYRVGKLFGVYLLGSNGAVIALAYAWNAANTSGHTKRTAKNAMTLMAFCIGNLIGPQLFQQKDAPGYTPAKIVLLVFLAGAFCLSLLLRVVVVHENRRRDKLQNREEPRLAEEHEDILAKDLTDRENPTFRYIY